MLLCRPPSLQDHSNYLSYITFLGLSIKGFLFETPHPILPTKSVLNVKSSHFFGLIALLAVDGALGFSGTRETDLGVKGDLGFLLNSELSRKSHATGEA